MEKETLFHKALKKIMQAGDPPPGDLDQDIPAFYEPSNQDVGGREDMIPIGITSVVEAEKYPEISEWSQKDLNTYLEAKARTGGRIDKAFFLELTDDQLRETCIYISRRDFVSGSDVQAMEVENLMIKWAKQMGEELTRRKSKAGTKVLDLQAPQDTDSGQKIAA